MADDLDDRVDAFLADPDREATRRDHADAVDTLVGPIEDAFADALARVLRRALTVAVPGYVVTAAVVDDAAPDPDALGQIMALWPPEAYALSPLIGDVYEAGALAAWQQHETAWKAATGDPALDPYDVVSEGSSRRMAAAQNRLVGIGEDAWLDARATLTRGITEGWSIDEMTSALEDRIGVAEARARTIARTETVGAVNAGNLDGVRALGRHAPARKVWLAAMDSRTRDSHYLADGQAVPADAPFIVDGWPLQYPGDPSAPARLTVNCRCTIVWEFDDPPTA